MFDSSAGNRMATCSRLVFSFCSNRLGGRVLLRCKTPTQLQGRQMAQQAPTTAAALAHSSLPHLPFFFSTFLSSLSGSAPVLSATLLPAIFIFHHPPRPRQSRHRDPFGRAKTKQLMAEHGEEKDASAASCDLCMMRLVLLSHVLPVWPAFPGCCA